MKRIEYLLDNGVFKGWLTDNGIEAVWRKFALFEAIGIYDHSLAIKLGVHFHLWYVTMLNRRHDSVIPSLTLCQSLSQLLSV